MQEKENNKTNHNTAHLTNKLLVTVDLLTLRSREKVKLIPKRFFKFQYHYNSTTNKCLSFLYKGCGGNINNHETLYGCEALCKKWDVPYGCVDRKNPTGICNIEGVTCPEGNICKYDRYGDGVCCDKETEEQYRKERKPECDEGKVLIKHQTSLGWVPLLGTKCSYEFCPEGADCVEGKWFAHCCGSEEKFGPKKA
ncbi:Kunitz/Bovine pancreatic trypsin inhibitor domain protein [Oesophagostomum dentatum]|uniref:Kunitz/Bovine pancreatic trypsin inhibitor domain protein n=1 Tax=Oesophagostomum dentatum TaxID=61180 RepID=A0A0B1T7R6_OESDE|nr:Kunitz/Bovine pancreatic trypsin inhibitor domain protein [Oesophagostomum dentatum]